jgi:hypothetical protein
MSDDKVNDLGINAFFKEVNQQVPVCVCASIGTHSPYTDFSKEMLKLNMGVSEVMKDQLKGNGKRGCGG